MVVIDRVIDAASGTFSVFLELPNPEHTIPGGLRCRVRFDGEPEPIETATEASVTDDPSELARADATPKAD